MAVSVKSRDGWGTLSLGLMCCLVLLLSQGANWLRDTLSTPEPYRVLEHSTERQPDGSLVFLALIEKLKCERLPIAEDGFFVVAIVNGAPVTLTWRPLDGRHEDENRGPSIAPLTIAIMPPPLYEAIDIWTTHACPTDASPDKRLVQKRVARLAGNVKKTL